jgi:hypothetical protein
LTPEDIKNYGYENATNEQIKARKELSKNTKKIRQMSKEEYKKMTELVIKTGITKREYIPDYERAIEMEIRREIDDEKFNKMTEEDYEKLFEMEESELEKIGYKKIKNGIINKAGRIRISNKLLKQQMYNQQKQATQ